MCINGLEKVFIDYQNTVKKFLDSVNYSILKRFTNLDFGLHFKIRFFFFFYNFHLSGIK